MLILPVLAFLVVTRITPNAPRAPYIAEAAASFNTEIDSTSFGLIRLISPGTPSINTRGSPPFTEPRPRTLIDPPAPGCAVENEMLTLGITPWSIWVTLPTGRFSMSLDVTWVTAPVRFTFFCVPYPTTTTSSRSCVFSFSKMSMTDWSPTLISCER